MFLEGNIFITNTPSTIPYDSKYLTYLYYQNLSTKYGMYEYKNGPLLEDSI